MARLGDYVNIKTGKLDANASSENGAYPFFTCSVIPLKIDTYSYDCECVLVAGNGDLNVKYYNGKFDAYQRTYIIESKDKTVLLVPYVYCFLDKYVETLRKQSIGGVIKYIKLGNLTDAPIPIYDIQKQKEIVSKLDHVDFLITARREQLAKLDELVKSRFVELVHENTTTPIKLMSVVEDERIITYGIVKPGEHTVGGVPIIKVKDFPKGVILMDDMLLASRDIESKYKRSRVKEGDLLFSIRGSVGRTAFVPKELVDANITQDTARISVSKKYNPHYVRMALEYEPVQQSINEHVRGVAVKGISLAELREIEIPVVEKTLQDSFGRFVEQTDKSKLAVQQSLEKLETLKKALMQKYFG